MTDTKSKQSLSSESYKPQELEGKWQKAWRDSGIYQTCEPSQNQEKFYALSMFPYPSGNLHMGHVRNYVITDVIARQNKMKGKAVLHPMGWDAFGLPAENAAIERKIQPGKWTMQNISHMKSQLNTLGLSIDWDREQNTSASEYYKWTQYLFLELFQSGLAYQKLAEVNWDPIDQTVLANEQVDAEGRSWRSGAIVEKKKLSQWFLKITNYANDLLGDLDKLTGWPEKVKLMQENWIGKSNGTRISFKLEGFDDLNLITFTTRADTLHGVSYIAIAPESEWIEGLIPDNYKSIVEKFRTKVSCLNDRQRTSESKDKSGVYIGVNAINPINNEIVPIWMADYVLSGYGTGNVMGVPAHDERDFEFAKKYKLAIKYVIKNKNKVDESKLSCYTEAGTMINSAEFNGLDSEEAINKITTKGINNNWAEKVTTYKLRDWLISRQRYWGSPIPIVHCKTCGVIPVPKNQLPVLLPTNVELNSKGSSPLKNSDWTKTKCPVCNGRATRESDTMDTFMCSSWYFLRFADPGNTKSPFDKDLVSKWLPVDQYVGGIEHAILHLLYARFLTKALKKNNLIAIDEPFKKLLTQGMVQGITYKNPQTNKYISPDLIDSTTNPKDPISGEGLEIIYEKMSKSKYNGVDPSSVISKYGADTARMFILFKAPPEKDLEWSDSDVEGQYRFLQRVWRLVKDTNKKFIIDLSDKSTYKVDDLNSSELELRLYVNKAIKEIGHDLEKSNQFNTAISELMKLTNNMNNLINNCRSSIVNESISILLRILAPFAPHIAEELWESHNGKDSIHSQYWPLHDESALVQNEFELVIQINGKVRGKINVNSNTSKGELEQIAVESELASKWLKGKSIVKVIVVPGKLVNIVVSN